jgi:hypothetical protein
VTTGLALWDWLDLGYDEVQAHGDDADDSKDLAVVGAVVSEDDGEDMGLE